MSDEEIILFANTVLVNKGGRDLWSLRHPGWWELWFGEKLVKVAATHDEMRERLEHLRKLYELVEEA